MLKHELENLELELLTDAIYRRYGYDFRNYSRASLTRRVNNFMAKNEFARASEIVPEILYDKSLFEALVFNLTVTTTEMFRDPSVYRAIRAKVVPFLKTFPFIRIWHAGCATGEEVYSMAIVMAEEGLYDRCQFYATDLNDEALDKARQGIYPVERIKLYTSNYLDFGGKEAFSDYYHSRYDSAIMNQRLKKNITFANHNLTSDSVFGEFHFIMCRNVMIYFDQTLQDRVLNLLHDSLALSGAVCLGDKENIRFSKCADKFEALAEREKIYRKKQV